MHSSSVTILLGTSVFLGGCNNVTQVVNNPHAITLQDAMDSVADGLVTMQTKLKQGDKTGLMPTEVDITFTISAQAKDANSGKVYIEAGATAAETLKLAKVGGEAGFSTEIAAQRGNTVTVKFKNAALVQPDPDKLATLLKVLDDAGVRPMLKPLDR